jgi:hypothetical protein
MGGKDGMEIGGIIGEIGEAGLGLGLAIHRGYVLTREFNKLLRTTALNRRDALRKIFKLAKDPITGISPANIIRPAQGFTRAGYET